MLVGVLFLDVLFMMRYCTFADFVWMRGGVMVGLCVRDVHRYLTILSCLD